MFTHVMVGTNDVERAKRFYDAALGALGIGEAVRNVNKTGQVRLFWRHEGRSFGVTQPIDGQPATVANGGTIGFLCASAEQLRAFHAAALANGGTSIEQPPGPRDDKPGSAHLAYVRDPDGNKLCVVYRPAAA